MPPAEPGASWRDDAAAGCGRSLGYGDPVATSAEEIRDSQRTVWAGLSASWNKWDAVIMAQLAPVGTAIVEALQIGESQQHLDIASGTGEPGLTIAARAPHGRVVLTDLSPEMLEVATRRAADQGVTNVETRVCSADDLPFEDGTFDSVSVRFGFMFFPDLAAATAELVRVLKPGGRLCASGWIKPEANPWTTIPMQAIASEVPLPPVDPDKPNMYRCSSQGQISALYVGAGLGDVSEWDVPIEMVTESAEQYWEIISDHVSLVAAALAQIDEQARVRMSTQAIDKVRAFQKNGEVRVPGLARCIVGTKP
jgi:SAM-dependent methyltransferase